MKFLKTFFSFAVILLLSGCITDDFPVSNEMMKSAFSEGEFKASNGVKFVMRFYCPKGITPVMKIPLIVYLHGAGQNGNDNEKQLDESLWCIYSFTYNRDDYKSFIIAPQCPAGVYWREDEILEALIELIEKTSENQIIDENRIYITGFSMGGDATWKIALLAPELPAAIVPVCGGPLANMEPDIPDVPSEMSDINIWAFNAFDDGVVRPTYSKRIMSELWVDSPKETLNFTMYPSGGHNPKQVYQNRDILIWMFSSRKQK